MTLIVIPAIIDAPAPLLLRTWARQAHRSKAVGIPLAVVGGAAFAWLAWSFPAGTGTTGAAVAADAGPGRGAYAAAAALYLGILPYTVLVMLPTYGRLFAAERQAASSAAARSVTEKEDVAGVPALRGDDACVVVREWQRKAFGRAALPVISLALAVWNTFFR